MNSTDFSARITLQNVLLATDFSEASMATVGYAAAIASNYGGAVFTVHVLGPQAHNFAFPESSSTMDESMKRWAEQQMNALLSSRQLERVPHEGIIRHGEIWDVLSQVVEQHQIDRGPGDGAG